MLDEKVIVQIVSEVIKRLAYADTLQNSTCLEHSEAEDSISESDKTIHTLDDPADLETLLRMKASTTARIGVGRAGVRLKTSTMLELRADHAKARDAVFLDVDMKLLNELGLFSVQTKCSDKKEFLTRPDLGRQLDDDAIAIIKQKCTPTPDVEVYVSDGLSSKAIEANIRNILPVLTEGLKAKGINVGTPFFVRFGRVPAMDRISEVLGSKVTCVLIGERPGLGSAESMSAYICYNARVGMPEARRTVVSNIHKNGIFAVEAGAYITDLICKILESKASGVDLQSMEGRTT